MGEGKGTKQSLAHSKFSVNRTQEVEESVYGSVRAAQASRASITGSILEMSEVQKEMSYRMMPETSGPTEMKPGSSNSIWRRRSLRSFNQQQPTAEDGPALKHHLEQVFIKPHLSKGD